MGGCTQARACIVPTKLRDFSPLLEANGVLGSILVQAAPTARETDYLLGLAGQHPWILGVVGWIDLMVCKRRNQSSSVVGCQPWLFVGIRPMLQDMTEREWILET